MPVVLVRPTPTRGYTTPQEGGARCFGSPFAHKGLYYTSRGLCYAGVIGELGVLGGIGELCPPLKISVPSIPPTTPKNE